MAQQPIDQSQLDADVMTSLADDTTPQLGGTLDLNGELVEWDGTLTQTIQGSNVLSGNAGGLTIKAATNISTGAGGGMLLQAGSNTSTGNAGTATLVGGSSQSGNPGQVIVQGGARSSGGTGGQANVLGGTGPTGGTLALKGGSGTAGGGGSVTIYGGSGTTTHGSIIMRGEEVNVFGPLGVTQSGKLSVVGANNRTVSFQSPSGSGTNRTWVLPIDDPAVAGDQFLKTDTSGNLSFATPGSLLDVQIFSASGTWNKPAGATKFEVWAVGAGAGGGGAVSTGNPSGAAAAGGGSGQGSYSFLTAGVGSSETVTVGTGGAGGVGGASSSTGGDSSFGAHVVAKGGLGTNSAAATNEYNFSIGNTNNPAGAVGQLLIPAGPGNTGGDLFRDTVDTIPNSLANGGMGADGPFGYGKGGRGGNEDLNASGVSNGTVGVGYGSGGGGACSVNGSGTNGVGGNGAGGLVVVKSYA